MSAIECLGYLGFGVKDLEAWKRFSTQIIGLQSVGRTEDGRLRLRMDAARK
jgi:catechol-2,3-dioxygenase